MNKYWFDTKRILGIGWRPITIEGWLTIGAFIAAVFYWANTHTKGSQEYYYGIVGLVALLLFICYIKQQKGT